MQVRERFQVDASPEKVWGYLTDPPRVAPCLPGAELLDVVAEDTYKGKVEVKVGPIAARYEGTATFEEVDSAKREAVLVARGDQQGAVGKAEANIKFTVGALDRDRTEVTVEADVSISGRLGRLGGGMIQTVSGQLFRKFAECVSAELRG